MKLYNLFALIGLAVAASNARAQTASVDVRQVYVPVVQPGNPDFSYFGSLHSPINTGSGFATLEWLYVPPSTPDATPTSTSIALPLHRVGYVRAISPTDYLVVGRRSTSGGAYVGHLARVAINYSTQALTVVASTDIGNVDPVDVLRDSVSSRLFVLDARARSVVAAPWTPAAALPTSFSTVFDHTAIAALKRPHYTRLGTHPNASGVLVYEPNGIAYTHCYSAGGTWIKNATSWQTTVQRPVVASKSPFVPLNRPWSLQVLGPATFPLSALVQSEGHANVNVSLTSATPTPSPLLSTATPGNTGSLSIPSGRSFDFRTCVRYGLPQNTSFYPLGEISFDLCGPFAGRENTMVLAELLPHATNGVTSSPAIVGELRIAFRLPDGTDPVTISGDSATLTPLMSLPFYVAGGDLPRDLSFALPAIPPEFAGTVALVQVVVGDGTQLAQTDVFGMQIRASTPYTQQP